MLRTAMTQCQPATAALSVRHDAHVLGAAHLLERLRTSWSRPLSDAVCEEQAADVARRRGSELGD